MKQKSWSEIAMKKGKIKPLKMSKTTLKSHWVDITDATSDDGGRDWHFRDYMCNNCCFTIIRCYKQPNYCSHCGARMVKTE